MLLAQSGRNGNSGMVMQLGWEWRVMGCGGRHGYSLGVPAFWNRWMWFIGCHNVLLEDGKCCLRHAR